MKPSISIHALNISKKHNIRLFTFKNILFMFSFFMPLIISLVFSLGNIFSIITIFSLILGPVVLLILRVGSDSVLIFNLNNLVILNKNSEKTISITEIQKIEISQMSGSRAPFELKINFNDIELKYLVDKFNFQNPNKKLKDLSKHDKWSKTLSPWQS